MLTEKSEPWMRPPMCLEALGLQRVLAADVDERARDAARVGRDEHALDQHVRALLQELAVLEGARL